MREVFLLMCCPNAVMEPDTKTEVNLQYEKI